MCACVFVFYVWAHVCVCVCVCVCASFLFCVALGSGGLHASVINMNWACARSMPQVPVKFISCRHCLIDKKTITVLMCVCVFVCFMCECMCVWVYVCMCVCVCVCVFFVLCCIRFWWTSCIGDQHELSMCSLHASSTGEIHQLYTLLNW